MFFYVDIEAICPLKKKLLTYGDILFIPDCYNLDEANIWCQTNGKGYMKVTGFFNDEIPISELLIKKINKNE